MADVSDRDKSAPPPPADDWDSIPLDPDASWDEPLKSPAPPQSASAPENTPESPEKASDDSPPPPKSPEKARQNPEKAPLSPLSAFNEAWGEDPAPPPAPPASRPGGPAEEDGVYPLRKVIPRGSAALGGASPAGDGPDGSESSSLGAGGGEGGDAFDEPEGAAENESPPAAGVPAKSEAEAGGAEDFSGLVALNSGPPGDGALGDGVLGGGDGGRGTGKTLETLEDAERERRPLDVKSPEAADPAASGALESADEDDFEIEGDLSGAPPPAPSSGGFEDSWNAARGVAGESLWEESPPAPAEAPKAAEAARGEDPSGSPSAGGAAPDPEDDLDGDGGEAPKEYLVEEDDLDGGGSGDDFGSLLRAEESKAGSIGRPAETDGGTGGEPDAGSKAPAAAADTETVAADRTRFLESLLDGSDTSLPKKVELDLDGIFDQAKKEAEALAPDATRVPAEAPKVEEGADALAAATAGETPAPPPEPLPPPAQKKVSKLKLLFFLAPIVLGVAGLIFGLYRIFGSGGAPEETPELVLTDPLEIDGEPQPGELAMPSFLLTLEGDDGKRAVAQVDFIIHYHDRPDLDLLKDNMVQVRDIFYRITKSRGPMILTDATARRQLQADLLSTLNDLPPFKTESDPRVTYVQISLLREK